jgi:hypothetical protein
MILNFKDFINESKIKTLGVGPKTNFIELLKFYLTLPNKKNLNFLNSYSIDGSEVDATELNIPLNKDEFYVIRKEKTHKYYLVLNNKCYFLFDSLHEKFEPVKYLYNSLTNPTIFKYLNDEGKEKYEELKKYKNDFTKYGNIFNEVDIDERLKKYKKEKFRNLLDNFIKDKISELYNNLIRKNITDKEFKTEILKLNNKIENDLIIKYLFNDVKFSLFFHRFKHLFFNDFSEIIKNIKD